MTPELLALLAEAKRLDAAATEGPWECDSIDTPFRLAYGEVIGGDDSGDREVFADDGNTQIAVLYLAEDGPNTQDNAEFITLSRTAVPAFVAEIERLQKKVAFYEAQATEVNNSPQESPEQWAQRMATND